LDFDGTVNVGHSEDETDDHIEGLRDEAWIEGRCHREERSNDASRDFSNEKDDADDDRQCLVFRDEGGHAHSVRTESLRPEEGKEDTTGEGEWKVS